MCVCVCVWVCVCVGGCIEDCLHVWVVCVLGVYAWLGVCLCL